MNIKGKPGADSLVRKCEWCYSTPFIYCWWLEWVNCWYLLGFTSFLHCRSIFYRSNFEGAPKVRCLFDTEKLILVSQHNFMTWSCMLNSEIWNHTSWNEGQIYERLFHRQEICGALRGSSFYYYMFMAKNMVGIILSKTGSICLASSLSSSLL